MPETQNLDLVGEDGQVNELHDFMLSLRKENAALHAVCATEKAARAKSLMEKHILRREGGS